VRVVAGGGDRGRLELQLEGAAAKATAIISIGLGGALAGGLKPGDWVVASGVIRSLEGRRHLEPTHAGWTASLLGMLPGARTGVILGSDSMIVDREMKRRAHDLSGASIVDMESHVVAAVATRNHLPFAVARVVSDAADRDLPLAAQAGMAADGGMDLFAVLRALAADPRQLPDLIRVGLEAETAFRGLSRGRDLLGPGLGRPDLGQLPLDVA
jgi:hypothetical protein